MHDKYMSNVGQMPVKWKMEWNGIVQGPIYSSPQMTDIQSLSLR